MNTKHTATPWTICEFKNGFKLEIVADDGIVATVAGTSQTETETKANAELICRAVNHHAELVTKLEEAERVIRWAAQESSGRVKAETVGGWLHHANQSRTLLARLNSK